MINFFIGIAALLTVFSTPIFIGSFFNAPVNAEIYSFGFIGGIAGSAICAYVVCHRLKFWEYRIKFPGVPIVAFLLVGLFWIIGFPWFVSTWAAIVRGSISKYEDKMP